MLEISTNEMTPSKLHGGSIHECVTELVTCTVYEVITLQCSMDHLVGNVIFAIIVIKVVVERRGHPVI